MQQGPAPSSVKLLPMVTNEAYQDVPKLDVLWDNGNFNFGGTHAHTVRLYQKGILNNGPPGGFGLCSVRHAAPRRFAVSGNDLRHGAVLQLFIQNDPDNGPPDTNLGPEDQAAGQVQTLNIELPLHPTNHVDPAGLPVWETAAELEPRLFFRLMAGRPDQSNIAVPTLVNVTDRDHLFTFQDEDQQDLFDPIAWNIHYVRVVNPDGTQFDAGWLPLSIEPGPDCP